MGEALLRRKANACKGRLIDLGTGTSFDIKTLVPSIDYTTLTSNDFMANSINNGSYSYTAWWAHLFGSVYFTRSYDATTGILSMHNTGGSVHAWLYLPGKISKVGTKVKVGQIDLGSGQTFDVASKCSDYASLTVDNFFVYAANTTTVNCRRYYQYCTVSISRSHTLTYDATTGTLVSKCNDSWGGTGIGGSGTSNTSVYLIY